MTERKIAYWDLDGAETLSYTDQDDAIEHILDDILDGDIKDELEICGYARMEKPSVEKFAAELLEHAIEDLDCNFELGSPDEDPDFTDDMKAASVEFAKAILNDYEPWACEVVKKETIDVVAWIKANKPEWLRDELWKKIRGNSS